MMNLLSQLCSSSRVDATCPQRTPVGQFPSRRLQTKDLRTTVGGDTGISAAHPGWFAEECTISGVRPEAAILEGFSEPYRGLPLSAPFIFFEFDRLPHSSSRPSRYRDLHTRRTV
jgi:hypothetical protein